MPLIPDLPPPTLPQRAVTAARTAAYRNRSSMGVLACGGAIGVIVAAAGVTVGIAALATAAFLVGAYVQKLVMGAK